jgi:tetratricopeptide (TPR) repeat protein
MKFRRTPAALLGTLALTLAAARSSSQTADAVTFNEHVSPIMQARCVQCHYPNGPAPFSLTTYAEARRHARQIADAVGRRYMPPWNTDPGDPAFIGQQPLTEGEMAVIQNWVERGAAEGHGRYVPPARRSEGWQLGDPDITVVPDEKFELPSGGADLFRVFVMRIPLKQTRFVRGLEFRPGNGRIIHHANILVDRTSTSRRINDGDPNKGASGLLARTAQYPSGHLLGWTPGLPDPLLPAGLAWQVDPGTDLVVQLHLQPTGKPEPVTFSIGLYFGAEAPTATPAVLRLGRQTIDIPAGDSHYTITDSYALPIAVEVLALKAHAHYRARTIRAYATRPDQTTTPLLSIANWDFRWQHVYRLRQPVSLPAGSRLDVEFTYDNSDDNPRNPFHPPRRVLWGPASTDEMGDVWIQVIPRHAADLDHLNSDFRRKWAAEDVAGLQTRLNRGDADVALHDDLALLHLELQDAAQALTHFRESLRMKPRSPDAHFNVGVALMAAGRYRDATLRYEEALRLDPTFAAAHNNLGNAFEKLGDRDQALFHYRQALRLRPGYASANNNIAFLLMARGELAAAVVHLREALRADPAFPDAHYNLGLIRQSAGAESEAAEHFTAVIGIRGDWVPGLSELAWVLATAADDRVRDPDRALRLAQRAAALSQRRNPRALDALAAAHAANADFERALAAIDEAIAINTDREMSAGLAERRRLYSGGQTYRAAAPRQP